MSTIFIFSLLTCSPTRSITAEGTRIKSSRDIVLEGCDADIDLRDAAIRAGNDVDVCSEGNIHLPRNQIYGGARVITISGRCK